MCYNSADREIRRFRPDRARGAPSVEADDPAPRASAARSRARSGSPTTLLRAGRLGSLEIVLDDSSVSRRHAEVRLGDGRRLDASATWRAPTAPTSTASGSAPATTARSSPRDIVQFGKVALHGRAERRDRSTGRRRTSSSSAAARSTLRGRAAADRVRPQQHAPGRRPARRPAPGRAPPRPHRERRPAPRLDPQRRGQRARRPARGDRPGRGRRAGAEAAAAGAGRRRTASPTGRFHFSKKLTQRCFATRRVDPLQHVQRRRGAAVDPEHRRRGDGVGPVRAAADAAAEARRAAPGPQLLPEAVHRGRPAPGRRPGRPRVGRRSSAPSSSRKQRDLFLQDDHDAGPGGRTARRVHRRPHPAGDPVRDRCWPRSSSCPTTRSS